MATTLQTTFAGLSLRNPIIVSSSGLTDSAAKNQKLCEAGAGAIVLKSLFEEQIMMEVYQHDDPSMSPEAADKLSVYILHHKLNEYLSLIRESKKVCDIPVIAVWAVRAQVSLTKNSINSPSQTILTSNTPVSEGRQIVLFTLCDGSSGESTFM